MTELEDVQTTVAVIDGLRARIAELEAELAEAYEVISHFKQGAEEGNAGG